MPLLFNSLIPKIPMFTLAVSCLTTSHLSWFMDLAFEVPMQYCSLQHHTWLLSPDTPTAEHYFSVGPAASLFLKLLVIALCSSTVSYWTPSDLGVGVIFQCHNFFPFCTIHGVLAARILEWFAIPSSSELRFIRTLHYLGWPHVAWLIASLN